MCQGALDNICSLKIRQKHPLKQGESGSEALPQNKKQKYFGRDDSTLLFSLLEPGPERDHLVNSWCTLVLFS